MQLKTTLTRRAGAAVLLSAVLLFAAPTMAHHAVQATVDIHNQINTKAVLTEIHWINPHTWLRFEITAPDGTVTKNVMIESLGIAALRRSGVTSKSAFKVGDVYDITYYPNRDGSPGGFMYSMILPDGREFSVKNSDPTAVPPPPAT
jgi:hypothetical protein